MKKSITLLALFCIAAFAQQKGTFTDTRDGKTYKTTKIGEQVWMAENLNYYVSGSRCYDNKSTNCEIYGRLYNWEAAMTICPVGWHLPSETELDKLITAIDGENEAGKALKTRNGWRDYKKGKSGKTALDFLRPRAYNVNHRISGGLQCARKSCGYYAKTTLFPGKK
jgi:uncharacterized protein (TIGR02145 family)